MDDENQDELVYRPIISFGIDNGELYCCRLDEAFVLGFEFCQIVRHLEADAAIKAMPIHTKNRERTEAAARVIGRECSIDRFEDVGSDEERADIRENSSQETLDNLARDWLYLSAPERPNMDGFK